MTTPSAFELWRRSGGDAKRYRALLREHGLLVDGPREPLSCGWTPGKADISGDALVERGDRLNFVADDGEVRELVATSDAEIAEDGMVTFQAADAEAHARAERIANLMARLAEPPEHAAARQPTRAERDAVTARLRKQLAKQRGQLPRDGV